MWPYKNVSIIIISVLLYLQYGILNIIIRSSGAEGPTKGSLVQSFGSGLMSFAANQDQRAIGKCAQCSEMENKFLY